MIKKKLTILNKKGLHARAAAKLIRVTNQFVCEIKFTKDNETVNGKSMMSLLILAAGKGSILEATFQGLDEKEAEKEVTKLFQNKFMED